MILVKMRPEQLQDAVKRNVPIIMPAGVVEYHGPHLPIGTDFLIANAVCDGVEKACECVLAPPLPFGPTMSWAAGPEEGEIDFAPEPFFQYVKEILKHIMAMGFKRIYVCQHHQGLEGMQSLCLRRAASELIGEVGRSWGNGWGRGDHNKLPNPNLFSWIKVASPDSFSHYEPGAEKMPVGHGGRGETQLIMGSLPETVRMGALDTVRDKMPPWLEDAEQANADEGKRWIEFCVQGWVRELSR
ncbi:TPA: creatininase family protein [bacterium]|nr:creatininase family protein [bacterium]